MDNSHKDTPQKEQQNCQDSKMNFNKNVIKKLVVEVITEEQKLDFKSRKKDIISLIQRIKKGEEVPKGVANVFYSILRDRRDFDDTTTSLGFTDKNEKDYKTYIDNSLKNNGDTWGHESYGDEKNRPSKSENKTYNYYITLEDTKDNIVRFIKSLYSLRKALYDFSKKNSTYIAFKTHRYLKHLIKDNDSLKVYYYDKKYKQDIEELVKKWVLDNNIRISNRTHTHGVDIGEDSYGIIISSKLTDVLKNAIENSSKEYSDEQWYNWIATHAQKIINKVNSGIE